MFIEERAFEVGDHVVTSIDHSCLRGTMLAGTKAVVTEIDPVRGYGIMDEEGNRMIEIGWII